MLATSNNVWAVTQAAKHFITFCVTTCVGKWVQIGQPKQSTIDSLLKIKIELLPSQLLNMKISVFNGLAMLMCRRTRTAHLQGMYIVTR